MEKRMRKAIMGAAATVFLAAPASADDIQYDLKVSGITCPFCIATSEIALRKVEGVKLVSGDLETGTIRVCTDGSVKFTDEQLSQVFLDKGFTYIGMETHASCDSFDNTNVLNDVQLKKRAAMHAKKGHGDEVFDFLGEHDHDGDGKPDHGPESHVAHDHDGDGEPDHEVTEHDEPNGSR